LKPSVVVSDDLVGKDENTGGRPVETFTRLFGSLLLFVYHCFDRVVINGYLSGLSRPGQVAYFFHNVVGEPGVGSAGWTKIRRFWTVGRQTRSNSALSGGIGLHGSHS